MLDEISNSTDGVTIPLVVGGLAVVGFFSILYTKICRDRNRIRQLMREQKKLRKETNEVQEKAIEVKERHQKLIGRFDHLYERLNILESQKSESTERQTQMTESSDFSASTNHFFSRG